MIEEEWKQELKDVFGAESFNALSEFIRHEYTSKKVFPPISHIFRAFDLTPFSQVRVVILGQDPYHNDGQACGLCFSVPKGVGVPPSLKNIYKEIDDDLGTCHDYSNGDLEPWARQGVFLLNAILTVVAHMPASHQGKGWELFTDTVIQALSKKREHIVFILWGKYAQSKKGLIDTAKHLVLEAPHPSPFYAHSGFFGCKHFSQCNEYLAKNGGKEIVW